MIKNIITVIYLFLFVLLIGIIHYNAITINQNITKIVEETESNYKDVLHDALVLENYGKFSNIIFVCTSLFFVFTMIFMKLLRLKYKWLVSPIVAFIFLLSVFLFYKYNFKSFNSLALDH